MEIRNRFASVYHTLMMFYYTVRIKWAFKHVDMLIKKNLRETEKAATAENWREIFDKNAARRAKMDTIYRREGEYVRVRDRHWCKRWDARQTYI